MIAELGGYDAWKTALPDDVYCPTCQRAVGAAGKKREGHDFSCPEHPSYAERRSKTAASVVRRTLKGVLAEHREDIRLDYVRDDKICPEVVRDGVRGVVIPVQIFVSLKEIEDNL